MIQLLIEAVFIGFFNIIIYYPIAAINKLIIQLFIVGFMKHLISYLIGIQDYYCRTYKGNNFQSKPSNIIIECLLEGLLFIYIGLLLSKLMDNRYLLFFLLGFFIHIISDFYGIHDVFLIYNCKK
jgi:hypothetical protein